MRVEDRFVLAMEKYQAHERILSLIQTRYVCKKKKNGKENVQLRISFSHYSAQVQIPVTR